MSIMIGRVLVLLVSFGISAGLGFWLIPFLHKLKFGQTILDIGPSWHKKKQGTPTMGGLMFIPAIVIGTIAGIIAVSIGNHGIISTQEGLKAFSGIVMALAFGAIGFLDDYIKVVKKRNLGLTARQKSVMQLIIGAFYLYMLYIAGDTSTIIVIPFIGQLKLGLAYYALAMFIIIGFVNAVNLTDGIDGLASSVTCVYGAVMMVVFSILNFQTGTALSIALVGGTLGFLVWNAHPAKVFMGDTGSMFLGGIAVALAFQAGFPLLLVMTGVIYWCEAFSVIIQVISFKTTGKRVFKMSPIHHHFELSGWSEKKIVAVFSIVSFIGGLIGIWSVLRIW